MNRCPLPPRASLRDLLRDLLGRQVEVRPGTPQVLEPGAPAYLAGYRFDDGGVAALAVTDLRLSAAAAAAIAAMPPKEAWAEVQEAGSLDGDLVEFLHEVVNVTAKLLNSPTTPHVALREHTAVPGDVPVDLAAVATEPSVRHDWTVGIDGYGEGTLTLLG